MKALRPVARLLAFVLAMAALGVAGGLAGAWQRVDHALFRELQGADAVAPATGLYVVDVTYPASMRVADHPEGFRRTLGAVLGALAARDRPPAVVVLDAWFSANGEGIEPLLAGIAALRSRGTTVVAAVSAQDRHGGLATDPLASHHPAIYGPALDGWGHSLLEQAHGVLKYARGIPTVLRVAGEPVGQGVLDALAVVVAVPPARRAALPENIVVPLGDDAALAGRTVRVVLHEDGTVGDDWRAALDARTQGASHLVIGSLDADRDNPLARPGPYLLAWAISDLLAGRTSGAREPLDGPAAIALVAAVAAAIAAAATAGGFHMARRAVPPVRWPAFATLATLPGLAAAGVLLVVLQALALGANRVLPLAFPATTALVAAVVARRGLLGWIDRATAIAATPRSSDEQASAYDVFVSYAHDPPEHARWVAQRVAERLAALRHGDGSPYRVFFDQRSIGAGRRWKQAIELALLGTRCFVPVVCERYFDRPYCREEIELADQLRIEGHLGMVPVARVPAAVPERYRRKLQYLDAGAPEFDAMLVARVASIVDGASGRDPVTAWQNGLAGSGGGRD